MRAIKKSVAVALACLPALVGPLAHAQTTPAATTHPMVDYLPREGLVALWSAEGDARDSAGENHGKLKGGATFAPGKFGQAFKLDGQDDYVDFGSPKALQIAGDQTISMWIKPDRLDKKRFLMAKSWNELKVFVTVGGVLNYAYGRDGKPRWEGVLLTTAPGAEHHITSPPWTKLKVQGHRATVRVGEWTHIAAVRNLKAQRSRWYVNGRMVCQGPAPITPTISTQSLWIAKSRHGHPSFSGLVDEVAIWNRALTGEEVRVVCGLSAQAFNPLADGLISLWTGDGHAKDSVGRNHSIDGKGVAYGPDRHGNPNCAFRFSDSGEYVTVPDSDDLDTDDAFTLSAWVCPKAYRTSAGGVGHVIVKWADANPHADYTINFRPRGRIVFQVRDAGEEPAQDEIVSRAPLPKNEWTHIAASFDRGRMKLYINGKLQAEKASETVKHTDRAEYARDDITIGAWWTGKSNFIGTMDDVAIWNRALGPKEVRSVFTARDLLDVLGAPAPAVVRETFRDRIVLDSGKVLKGTIENTGLEVTTFFGKIVLPARRVAGVAPLDPSGGRAWVLLADGQAVVGTLATDAVRLKLSIGSTLRIPLSSVRQIGCRISKDRPASKEVSGPVLDLRSGERLAWTNMKEKLRLRTPYGTVDLPAEALAGIEFDARKAAHRARLSGGSSLCGELLPERLTLSLRLGPQVAVARERLLRLARPIKVVSPPEAAVAIMRNGDRLVGRVGDKALAIRTRFGPVAVPPRSAQEVKFQPPKAGDVPVAVRTWDGTELAGTLVAPSVTFTLVAGGPPLKVPAAQIVSISRSVAMPPPEIRKRLQTLVGQLGAESYKDRAAATKELIEMGPSIAPFLRKHLTSTDPEVRERIRMVLDKLSRQSR